MNPRCSDPDLQMAVLNDLRDAVTLTPDLALHLEGCAACQTAAERSRRMASVWMADQMDEDVIAAAAARFQARNVPGRAAPPWFDVVPFASAGVVAGYLLLAVTGTISWPWKSRHAMDAVPQTAALASSVVASSATGSDAPRFAPVFAATDEGAKWARIRPHIETVRGVAPLVNGLRLELKRGESAGVDLIDGHASNLEGPCVVEFWSSPTEVSGWRMTREESIASPPLAAPSESGSPVESAVTEAVTERTAPSSKKDVPHTRESGAAADLHETVTRNAGDAAGPGAGTGSARAWARAAAALRDDDFGAADRAFGELGHSPDAPTRDAARLARAQLWISHGREAAVRPVLEQLARSGATALVRQRAAEFLYR